MSDFDKMINDDKPTLVDFFATWCGPCRMQAPILVEVKKKIGNLANIVKIDIDRNSALADSFNVRSVPTLILFRNGEIIWRASGLQQAANLEQLLREHA